MIKLISKLILIPLILNLIAVLAFEVTMVNDVIGSYKLEKSDNFDAFMKELGVGFLKRQAAGEWSIVNCCSFW